VVKSRFVALTLGALVWAGSPDIRGQDYCWLQEYQSDNAVCSAVSAPEGYIKTLAVCGSFADWLRHLPLKEDGATVFLYDGRPKGNQAAHRGIIDIDVGDKDLQQCADAIMRLRAEYLYSRNLYDKIEFNFTSGDTARFRDWIGGMRPDVEGSRVTWRKSSPVDSSYQSLRKYLDIVFTYAGSYSLNKQLKPVPDIDSLAVGDIFIQGGFPGHAVIVVDMATHSDTGKKIFLLAQSYMPAQDMHILKNPKDAALSPWYSVDFGETLVTPEWLFRRGDAKRF
jgi:hypothetical protein